MSERYIIFCIIYMFFVYSFLYADECNNDFDIKQIIINHSYVIGKIYPLDYRNDTLFFVNPNKKKFDGQTHYNIEVYKDSLVFQNAIAITFDGVVDIVDILVNDKYYILLDLVHLWIYDRFNLEFVKMIELPNTMFRMDFSSKDENEIELSFCGFSSNNENDTSQTYCYRYNLTDDTNLFYSVSNPDYIELTYIRRQLESNKRNLFAVSEPSRYSIRVYDMLNAKFFNIILDKKDWNNPLTYRVEIDKDNPRSAFNALIMQRDKLTLIDFVQFVNDSTLFVFWSKPIEENVEMSKRAYYFDVWFVSEMQAKLIKEDIQIAEKYCRSGSYYPSLAARRFGFKRNFFYTVQPIPFYTNNIDISCNINDLISEYLLNNISLNSSVYFLKLNERYLIYNNIQKLQITVWNIFAYKSKYNLFLKLSNLHFKIAFFKEAFF